MKNSNTSNIFIFSYLKNSILYKPENTVIKYKQQEYDFLSLEKRLVTWRENGVSYNEKNKINSLTTNEVWVILQSLGYKVNQFNFRELHKKEHFDYIGKEVSYYRNDVNDSVDKANLSTEIVNEYDLDGLNITNLFTLRFLKEKKGFILHSDGRIEKYP
jgi:hypothetical protein